MTDENNPLDESSVERPYNEYEEEFRRENPKEAAKIYSDQTVPNLDFGGFGEIPDPEVGPVRNASAEESTVIPQTAPAEPAAEATVIPQATPAEPAAEITELPQSAPATGSAELPQSTPEPDPSTISQSIPAGSTAESAVIPEAALQKEAAAAPQENPAAGSYGYAPDNNPYVRSYDGPAGPQSTPQNIPQGNPSHGGGGVPQGNPNSYTGGGYGAATGPNGKKMGTGFAVASLILGIASLVLFCSCMNVFTAILAIIFGVIQLVSYEEGKGMAIAGIVTSALSIVFLVVFWALALTSSGVSDILESDDFLENYQEYLDDDYDDFDEDYDFDEDDFFFDEDGGATGL